MKWFSDQVVWARGSLRERRHLPRRTSRYDRDSGWYATAALEFVLDTGEGSSASCESSEMVGGDGQRDPFAGLAAQGAEHLRVNWSEDLYGECGVERLVVGLRGAFTDDPEMSLHRGGVRVDLNDRHLGAVVVDVLVERDQLGLALLDELDEARDSLAFGIQLAWLETIGGNEDQRCAGRG